MFGIGRVGEGVDVLRRDAELLGLDGGEDRPVDGLRPLAVAVGDRRSEWLLGEHLGQDRQRVGTGRVRRAEAGELARVGRPSVALAGDERLLDQIGVLERPDLPGQPSSAASAAALPSVVVPWATQTMTSSMSVDRREAAVAGDHHALSVVERRLQEGRALRCRPGSRSTSCCARERRSHRTAAR